MNGSDASHSISRMMEEARQMRDREKRLAVYQEIDRIYVQELAVLVPITSFS